LNIVVSWNAKLFRWLTSSWRFDTS